MSYPDESAEAAVEFFLGDRKVNPVTPRIRVCYRKADEGRIHRTAMCAHSLLKLLSDPVMQARFGAMTLGEMANRYGELEVHEKDFPSTKQDLDRIRAIHSPDSDDGEAS